MDETIRIHKRESEVSTVSVEIFRKKKLNISFKTKLYRNGINDRLTYFHSEFVFKSKRSDKDRIINLTPNSFIVMRGENDEKEKTDIILTEVYRNIFIGKTQNLAVTLERYMSGSIDILNNDGSLKSAIVYTNSTIILGKYKLYAQIVIRELGESGNDIGVRFTLSDSFYVDLSMYDFLDLWYKIRDINFMSMTMLAINYLGRPEIGTPEYETDLRNQYFDISDADEFATNIRTVSKSNNNMDSLITTPYNNKLDKNHGW